jgi:hypothetical protein
MESADREGRPVVRFALVLASLVLAGAAIGAVIFGPVMLLMAPQVGSGLGYRAIRSGQGPTRPPTVVAVR